MALKLSEIAKQLGCDHSYLPNRNISLLLTDSRSLTKPEHTLFFALSTLQNDGHKFVKKLYQSGVLSFVVNKREAPLLSAEMPDAAFIAVDDTLLALQNIAAFCRRNFKNPVVAITGSRGKTVVKEWLNHIVETSRRVVRSPRSFNSQIGVPLSVWNLEKKYELAIFEAGISQPGEMERLQEILLPDIGIFTNIGDEHNAGFSDINEKCREKMRLFRGVKELVYCADHHLIARTVEEILSDSRRRSWTLNPNIEAWLHFNALLCDNATVLCFNFNGENYEATLHGSERCNIENACHVITASLVLGISPEAIIERFTSLPQVNTRLSVIEGVNHCMLITDTGASADPFWLVASLDFMRRRTTPDITMTLVLINPEKKFLSSLPDILTDRGVTRLIFIGENLPLINAAGLRTENFTTLKQMLSELTPTDFDHELILVESADMTSVDSVVEMLEVRRHETVLEVNLDALVANFNLIRSHLKPTTGIVAMVKADGYGAGSYELAKTLQAQGAAYLAVAVADEGVELRYRGITMPIMVLNPKVTNYRTLFRYKLEPEVYSFAMLQEIINQAQRAGVTNFPVHIKIDSGMHRLGFLYEDMPRLVAMLQQQNAVFPKSVFSHLATADCPDMDDYTKAQFDYFDKCYQQLQQGFSDKIMRHILNSIGTVRFPQYQFDMVRLGICLYGVSPLPLPELDTLVPVSTLRSVIISIKDWESGTTIGYSRRGVLSRKSRIATIPIGYADGLNRQLGRGNSAVWINGCRCPIVGNICMDICMVDVTDCPCSVGDSVEIFGRNINVAELADTLDTIPYEVLTSVSQRVKRIYYRE
ncbi:MAG: bifunctional UDP-N-acetylmuramoyl-tripeptide:D-alanyl-D-alanine ligase/alanine racemase [Muribaculum sp.]|nr:bifunctional UDP-N-acetylmuramoyl-tripeptide:D-alanyl-D-alanine ligase/alanine racemase [Muribaculaceae bacterium]MCM1081698.1 bifunctional UDP-N-acetylmuramoyl-tripeptide:D-alanyl-D-alanine ligase/alanine racemase [Muribaculum sp.]